MTISQANMRISAVDGTAFIDFSAADVLTANIGKRLTVFDSAGKKLIGFIKAAGTGETLDSEEITGYDHQTGYGTFTVNVNGHDIDSAITATVGDCYNDFTDYSGKLLKLVTIVTLNSGQPPKWAWMGSNLQSPASPGSLTDYRTGRIGRIIDVANTSATNFSATVSVKQVLTPSATGVTIVSTPGGAVFNWESKEAGFNYNDWAGYEYLITNQRAIFANYYRQMRAA